MRSGFGETIKEGIEKEKNGVDKLIRIRGDVKYKSNHKKIEKWK